MCRGKMGKALSIQSKKGIWNGKGIVKGYLLGTNSKNTSKPINNTDIKKPKRK